MNYKEFENCAFNRFMKLFSGKWKPLILFHFFESGDIRFTDLWRIMPVVSKKVLLEQLKELEEDGIVHRKQINTFPPEVYYGLTDKGRSLAPLMQEIEQWTASLQNN
ncbi:helix-turn-helix domain-containing protein [Elizabethkingia sp. HX WHF]|uniref:winged helix-turn-helix transcriptional regulator n=2 Tax=Weeksellaceae TaxID=2762318 RepID=UPI00099A76DE|nr:helix-turn-helix domain-containing protein [Elizabethkingia bruuniana]ATL42492.1 transcriptional regulator [Elizabethkingia miricola]MDX8563741.1 helix-turn-helix domain-containing protein [Elizabethkingia sp. HX WHF]MCL1637024.1 helix-turn-helix transcriptional regulator [Elizabethkingia bruuniana]OPC20180.1 HxlR family transcriptional regulator [Elizabethkingia bruuniana]OPC59246.1 HxlR family transcriptional regulator [Elizabethkingia bruuniana]